MEAHLRDLRAPQVNICNIELTFLSQAIKGGSILSSRTEVYRQLPDSRDREVTFLFFETMAQ